MEQAIDLLEKLTIGRGKLEKMVRECFESQNEALRRLREANASHLKSMKRVANSIGDCSLPE
jgi:hypothetical protein